VKKRFIKSTAPSQKLTIKNGRKSPYCRDRLMYVRGCWLGKCRAKYRRLIGFNMFGRYIKDSIVVAPTMPQNDYFCSGSHFSLLSHPTFPYILILLFLLLDPLFPYTLTLLFLRSDPLFHKLSSSFSYTWFLFLHSARTLFSLHSHPLFPMLGPSFPYTLSLIFLHLDFLFTTFSPSFSYAWTLFCYTFTLLFLRSDPLFPTLSPSFS
jgi:hypothetical protein